MRNIPGIVPLVLIALVLDVPPARAQEDPGRDDRARIRRRMTDLHRAKQAAYDRQLISRVQVQEEDPFDGVKPSTPGPQPLPSMEAIDAELGGGWAEVFEVDVFGRVMGDLGVKEHLSPILERQLDVARAAFGLTPGECERLCLAATGDVARYLGRIGEERRRFDSPFGRPSPDFSQEDFVWMRQEFRRGPFGEDSLFGKVLAKILADRGRAGAGGPDRRGGRADHPGEFEILTHEFSCLTSDSLCNARKARCPLSGILFGPNKRSAL